MTYSRVICGALALLTVAGSAAAQAPAATPPRPPPAPPAPSAPVALALEAAQTAVSTCTANGYKVAVSVVDAAGVLKVLIAGDGVGPGAVTSSTRKAFTTITYKAPTAEIQEKVKTDADLAAKVAADPKLFARAGAQLILSKGEIVGAIGVGGAPGGEKDDVCAVAAVDKIKARL